MTKFDVFLSFRGIDTGRTFVSHLYHALSQKQIRIFKNDEDDRSENQEASSQVLESIQESRIAIAVISKNYTDSKSCLDELSKMIECKEKGSLVVVPIFYGVDTFRFEKKANKLAATLVSKQGETENLDMVKKWSDALIELTSVYKSYAIGVEEDADMIDKVMDYISGHLQMSSTRDSEMVPSESSLSNHLSITELVSMVNQGQQRSSESDMEEEEEEGECTSAKTRLKKRNVTGKDSVPFSSFDSLVGIDRKVKEVGKLLELDSKDGVCEIGIWGVEGVGKTSLARCIYEQISPQFQDYYYYNNNNNNKATKNKSCLLEEITRAALKTPMSKSLVYQICDVLKAKLGHRKVLLVVDGLNCIDQVKGIKSVARSFGPGSRLILITQDKSLLVECDVKHLYEVESLRYEEALQLFTQFAFKQKDIPRGFHQLSLRAVLVAGCLPLALKVLGSFLYGRNIKEWEFEIVKLEESRDKGFGEVSSYIKYPPKLNRYSGEDAREKFPSYCFAFV